jgi:alpha-glucosidase
MSENNWWRGSVIYQIYPRSFYDSNGDGIGDLPGITERLPYVADLGVDGIWLSPFYPSPMADFGYDITEHCQVHPDYGTMEDLDALVAKAHELGLKVVIDAVLNHTSVEHPWFEESRQNPDGERGDFYQWADAKPDGSPPNNWIGRYAESQWTWCPVREQYYRHQYMQEQPALNLSNPKVLEERLRFMRKWLDRGIDGLRFDAVTQYYADEKLRDNPPNEDGDECVTPVGTYSTFAKQLHKHDCNDKRIEPFLEDLVDQAECAGCTYTFAELDVRYNAYTSLGRFTGEKRLNAAYTPDPMGVGLSPEAFATILRRLEEHADPSRHVWTLTNHDAERLVSRWGGEELTEKERVALSVMAAALVGCLPGQVCFFQGEELGLPNAPYAKDEIKDPQGRRFWPKDKGRDRIRHPFPWDGSESGGFTTGDPWLPAKGVVTKHHVEGQSKDGSVLAIWKEIIRFRRNTPALRLGDVEVLKADDESGLLGLARSHEGERVEAWFRMRAGGAPLPHPEGEVLTRSNPDLAGAYGYEIVRTSASD